MSVHKKKDGRWQVNYRDGDKIRSKTFPAGKRGKNQAVAFDKEVQWKKATSQELPRADKDGIYLDDLTQEWLDYKKAQGRKLTWLRDWANIMNRYILPDLTTKPAHSLTQADILAVVNAHWADHAQSTRNRYAAYIKAILEYGVEQGHLRENPLRRWKKGKEQRRQSSLTLDDLRRIQDAALQKSFTDKSGRVHHCTAPPAAHLAWAIEVAWHVPVRPGRDLYGLRFDQNVRHDKGGIEVSHSKVGRRAFLQLPDEFMRELWDRSHWSKSGHIIEYRDKPVKRLDTALANVAERAGITYRVTMYDIRHLWITTALDQGHELSVIAHMAGTSTEMLHQHYYEPHAVEQKRAMESMPKLQRKERKGKVVKI